MALDYEFVPIDVRIVAHPKSDVAGPEAMGLWLWGMAYSRLNRLDGTLPRTSVLKAWGGKRNIMLAKRLVEAGLWLSNEDGSWSIFNYEKKGAGRQTSSKERMRALRERRKSDDQCDAESDVTVRHCDASRDVTSVTLCSPSISNSLSDLSQRRDPDPDRSPTPGGFSPGTAAAVEALDRYQDAVRAATGKTFLLPRAPFHADDLCRLLNAHAPPRVLDALDWLGPTIAAWVKVTDRKYAGGWTPSKLLDWLNADRPDRTERPKSAAEITKQPFDENAPWMKVGA